MMPQPIPGKSSPANHRRQIIADLQRKLDERTTELGQRNSEYGERIEQQSAAIDVLKVMSASPGDPQPVFDLIVRRAQELRNGWGVTLCEFDGHLVHLSALCGKWEPSAVAAYSGGASPGADACIDYLPGDTGSTGRPHPRYRCRARVAPGDAEHWLEVEPGAAAGSRWCGDRRYLADFGITRRLLRQPGRIAANLRRAGGDRHQQR
jgi:hypothetical protein